MYFFVPPAPEKTVTIRSLQWEGGGKKKTGQKKHPSKHPNNVKCCRILNGELECEKVLRLYFSVPVSSSDSSTLEPKRRKSSYSTKLGFLMNII